MFWPFRCLGLAEALWTTQDKTLICFGPDKDQHFLKIRTFEGPIQPFLMLSLKKIECPNFSYELLSKKSPDINIFRFANSFLKAFPSRLGNRVSDLIRAKFRGYEEKEKVPLSNGEPFSF